MFSTLKNLSQKGPPQRPLRKQSRVLVEWIHDHLPSASLTTTVKYFTAPLVSLNQLQLKVKLMEDLLISTSFLFTRIYGGGGGGPGIKERKEPWRVTTLLLHINTQRNDGSTHISVCVCLKLIIKKTSSPEGKQVEEVICQWHIKHNGRGSSSAGFPEGVASNCLKVPL